MSTYYTYFEERVMVNDNRKKEIANDIAKEITAKGIQDATIKAIKKFTKKRKLKSDAPHHQ